MHVEAIRTEYTGIYEEGYIFFVPEKGTRYIHSPILTKGALYTLTNNSNKSPASYEYIYMYMYIYIYMVSLLSS